MNLHECPTCKRPFEDDARPLTTVTFTISATVAPGEVVTRIHIADIVQEALLSWMHENTYDTVESGNLLEVVIAR